jgi:hypothetical protein
MAGGDRSFVGGITFYWKKNKAELATLGTYFLA